MAPLIFLLLEKTPKWIFFLVITILLFLVQILDFHILHIKARHAHDYGFIASHIYLFSLGMFMCGVKFENLKIPPIFLLLYPILYIFQRFLFYTGGLSEQMIANYIISYILIIFYFLFCLYIINYSKELPLQKIFENLGKYSYSIYLFHLLYYSLIGLSIGADGFSDVILTTLLFPLFFIFCSLIENGFSIENWKSIYDAKFGKQETLSN
ncbi:MAG: acyltransferase family protein [Deltaproteobacteria bacterium]|uniref:Acyltransferase family protein n=1 Tax=Candidatus Zymogenus saltonus TaxID=2844893 RepID=A0A9D8KDU7_9DELT|nr:acyltransferase family protein [Candidatus Zymogenus saltonus]